MNAFVFSGDGFYLKNDQATAGGQLTASKYPTYAPGSVITIAGNSDKVLKFNRSYEFEWQIKATKYARPNTTYYFKASGTEGANGRYPSLTTGNSFTAEKIILPNGGFEGSQDVWLSSNSNGSASTVTLNSTANQVHFGTKALKINVTNRSSTNSVKLTHSGFTGSSSRTYLLRFWAFSETNNAALTVNLKSSAGDNINQYRISKRFDAAANGWQAYEHAFKVPDGPVTLEITFNSNAVYCDNYLASRQIAKYLVELGHKSFVFISGPQNTSTALDRKRGFEEVLTERGGLQLRTETGEYTFESGFRIAEEVLSHNTKPDCIFCANDIIALGAIEAIKVLGLRIPQD
ncbi:MAG: hypothetical protein EOP51_34385, partial [Sphingobacteriales bacterium]